MFSVTAAMNILMFYAGIQWTGEKVFLIGLLSFMGYFGAILAFPRKGR